jgi:hypothetical protein
MRQLNGLAKWVFVSSIFPLTQAKLFTMEMFPGNA